MEFNIFMTVYWFWFVDANARKERKGPAAVLKRAGDASCRWPGNGSRASPEKANRQCVGASCLSFSSKLMPRKRAFDGFFHMAFRLLWQWTHPAVGQEPDTGIFARTVEYDCAFLRDSTIKARLWMRPDDVDEILLPWIPFKVRELFNNVAQLNNAHALQRFLEGSPPLFTQSFHIYKFIEWHRCTFVDYVWGSCRGPLADFPVIASIVALMQAVSAGPPVFVKDNFSCLVINQEA